MNDFTLTGKRAKPHPHFYTTHTLSLCCVCRRDPALRMWNATENVFSRSTSFKDETEDEEELRWAALQRLPTYARVRRGIFRDLIGESKEVEIGDLEASQKRLLLDRLVNSVDHDPEQFFARVRKRFDAVDLKFPKIEVRFQNLRVESFVHVGSRALPTIPNFIFNMTEALLRKLRLLRGKRSKLTILDNVSGIVRPSRLTLLLGPPSSGKTTLLLALAGRLGSNLETSGTITYNGYKLNEIVAPRTSAYVSQQDWHVAEMTVRQTLEFAGRCQGVGFKYDMLLELARREKLAGLKPDEDLDIFMKSSALGGQETSLVVEYIMKILGLDTCADTLVGDEMIKGISGGQKKRLTTGELLVGPARVLFMDEISNGLDSSTTHQIIKYLKHSTHALEGTTVISLLQPAPETYELFDDIILMSEGQIIYQGPREEVLGFFSSVGFSCPERKSVADFLQEVTSKKDQQQYWSVPFRPYRYIPPGKFAEVFRSYPTGKNLSNKLAVPFDKRYNHPAALSTSQYGVNRSELLKINFSWQRQLMKQNSFIYVFKFVQLLLVALITMTVFCRTTIHHDTINDGNIYLGALYFSMVIILFNGFTEVPMLVAKLPVLYKHRDLHFYPSWAYTLPSWLLSVPTSIIESLTWVGVTYYVIGYDPQFTRFLQQFLLFFSLHQMSLGLFRVIGSLGRHMIVANTFGSFAMLVVMALGGFIISRDSIPTWWIWGYWISPLMYAQNAVAVNEFLGHSWQKKAGNNSDESLGLALLRQRSLFPESYWYWIGVGALLGYTVLFNLLFTLFLAFLNPWGKLQAVVTKEELEEKEKKRKGDDFVVELREYLQHSGSLNGKYFKNRGMVLPFQPLSLSFRNINYYVEVPLGLKQQGIVEDKLQLLMNITGAFRPGVLTALVGVSGAGKTTLMDVLAGRKTGGIIEGDIYISGYSKKQETFARISGYCEQNDVHSPCLTVLESLLFSAWLRLPVDVDIETQRAFVHEVMELVELTPLSGALVGLPGVDGLSTEQRKRLTIAVELVANPSIVFMDEPTSGLDARSAAIVMRTVRNIVNTGRTIVCTIHQPSIDIFESFDELLFMKRGGELIYAGPLGQKSCELVKYFESIEGVPKIKPGHNPAAWMLDVTSYTEEQRLGVNFAEIYKNSSLFHRNKELVDFLSKPSSISKELEFPTRYSRPLFSQFLACLWKQNLSYWRNPQYTAVRYFYTVVISLMLGTICWKFGSKRDTQQDLFNAMGSMYAAILFIGITNASAAQPVVSIERFVSYRERAAGMYSALPFAFAQVFIEFPYVFAQSAIYSTIFYAMASFEWNAIKFLWYLYFMYFTVMYFTFYGMMTTAVTPNHNVASIIAAPFYMLWNLFSGFMIPYKRIPIWWRWYYWANPVAWTLYGLLVSQYGDDERQVKLLDGIHRVSTKQLLHDLMGYRHDFLGISAIMVVGFCVFFAFIFAFAIKAFNFQRR
ncbi:PREDICTED: ABC transporter G family member 32 [Tarenaya hassleriana]|uniref:ABC transporter G family member 32 n=1 Tax=Tarenaya hassleriana TaxID=28532 RepID=UPI00053C3630|nr:PREDICTED: ABC transporter G family member 32 [Tarenaya hassleriana]